MTEPVTQQGPTGVPVPAQRLASETLVLEFILSSPSFSARVDSRALVDGTDADSNFIHVKKDLIDKSAPTLQAIHRHANQFKGWLRLRTMPGYVLKGGMIIVPVSRLAEVDRGITQFKVEREALVTKLVEEFGQHKQEAEARLGSLFKETDYPAAATLLSRFGVKARFWTFDVPKALKAIDSSLWEREQQRVQAEWQDAASHVREALREGFAQLVEHMADRLTPGEDGKPKAFRESTLKHLKDFLSTFSDRNLTDDQQLGQLVADANALLAGVTPQNLRKQETTRERVLNGFAMIRAALQPITKGRRFTFDEDEDGKDGA